MPVRMLSAVMLAGALHACTYDALGTDTTGRAHVEGTVNGMAIASGALLPESFAFAPDSTQPVTIVIGGYTGVRGTVAENHVLAGSTLLGFALGIFSGDAVRAPVVDESYTVWSGPTPAMPQPPSERIAMGSFQSVDDKCQVLTKSSGSLTAGTVTLDSGDCAADGYVVGAFDFDVTTAEGAGPYRLTGAFAAPCELITPPGGNATCDPAKPSY